MYVLFGSVTFLIIVSVFIIAEIGFLANDLDDTVAPIAVALIAFLWMVFFTDTLKGVELLTYIVSIVSYAIVGVIWSIKKWWSFVTDKRQEVVKDFNSRIREESLMSYAARQRPKPNKQRIVTWMLLWPFSMSWWLLSWPRRLFSTLYEYISTTFDRITDRLWPSE